MIARSLAPPPPAAMSATLAPSAPCLREPRLLTLPASVSESAPADEPTSLMASRRSACRHVRLIGFARSRRVSRRGGHSRERSALPPSFHTAERRDTRSAVRGPLAAWLTVVLLMLVGSASVQAQGSSRIKELVVPAGAAPVQLLGYGLVVGLDRTGDRARGRSGSPYTVQSIANMLQRFGVAVDPAYLGSRNAAAVMVTATLDPFAGPGSAVDVTVASLGDARSLAGGVLLMTPLQDMASEGEVYAMAQGPVLTGTLLASAAGSSTRTGPTNTGRVPNGGSVVRGSDVQLPTGPLDLVLRRPDYTNAASVADAVNRQFDGAATVIHPGLVRVEVPDGAGGPAGLMAALESVRVAVDAPARVVVNERTGTVVAGGAVSIGEVMITSGALTISTAVDPAISQPGAFSDGQTVAIPVGSTDIDQRAAQSVVLRPNTTVAELAAALNELGLPAREVIAVLQAIDQAGALQGELVVL